MDAGSYDGSSPCDAAPRDVIFSVAILIFEIIPSVLSDPPPVPSTANAAVASALVVGSSVPASSAPSAGRTEATSTSQPINAFHLIALNPSCMSSVDPIVVKNYSGNSESVQLPSIAVLYALASADALHPPLHEAADSREIAIWGEALDLLHFMRVHFSSACRDRFEIERPLDGQCTLPQQLKSPSAESTITRRIFLMRCAELREERKRQHQEDEHDRGGGDSSAAESSSSRLSSSSLRRSSEEQLLLPKRIVPYRIRDAHGQLDVKRWTEVSPLALCTAAAPMHRAHERELSPAIDAARHALFSSPLLLHLPSHLFSSRLLLSVLSLHVRCAVLSLASSSVCA
jgi:hypothetical protein